MAARWLVTVLFFAVFALTAPLGYLLTLIVTVVARPFDPQRRVTHAFLSVWSFGLLHLNPFWKVEVRGRELLPPEPAILIANHQSAADIFAVMGIFYPFKFVSKGSLFAIPIVGWAMQLAGYVGVERGRSRSTHQMRERCRKLLRARMSLLIFPEGTYAPPGELLPFKRGAFQLAVQEQVAIVPVLIEGTRQLMDGDGPWLAPAAHIRITLLAPLLPDTHGEDDAHLAHRVRGQFLEALGLHQGRRELEGDDGE